MISTLEAATSLTPTVRSGLAQPDRRTPRWQSRDDAEIAVLMRWGWKDARANATGLICAHRRVLAATLRSDGTARTRRQHNDTRGDAPSPEAADSSSRTLT
jgi:hypothetical protein